MKVVIREKIGKGIEYIRWDVKYSRWCAMLNRRVQEGIRKKVPYTQRPETDKGDTMRIFVTKAFQTEEERVPGTNVGTCFANLKSSKKIIAASDIGKEESSKT